MSPLCRCPSTTSRIAVWGSRRAKQAFVVRPCQDDFDTGLWPVTASEFRSPAEKVFGLRKLLHFGTEVPSSSPVKLCNRPQQCSVVLELGFGTLFFLRSYGRQDDMKQCLLGKSAFSIQCLSLSGCLYDFRGLLNRVCGSLFGDLLRLKQAAGLPNVNYTATASWLQPSCSNPSFRLEITCHYRWSRIDPCLF